MGFFNGSKKPPLWAKALVGCVLVVLAATAIVLPIVLTAPEPPTSPAPSTTREPTTPTPRLTTKTTSTTTTTESTPTTTEYSPTTESAGPSETDTSTEMNPSTVPTTPEPNLNSERIECYPFRTLDQENCIASGCLWDADNLEPICYLPDSSVYGYEVAGELVNLPDGAGFTVDLRRLRLSEDTITFSLYGGDFDEVTFEVNYYSDSTLGFALYPKGTDRLSLRPPVTITTPSATTSEDILYEVRLISEAIGAPFNFQVVRKGNQAVLFDTSMGGLTIAEQFLMISTKLPSSDLYGFGENTHDTLVHDTSYRKWPIFARGSAPGRKDLNVYGSQPFYMVGEDDGSFHGVFLLNSHAMDVTIMPSPGITFRSIGGMLEFFFFLGPEPESVVQQYSEVIGRTFMPPYFALGFQLSRWGYGNTANIKQVIENNRKLGIPQDIQYADIDYMDNRRDFTIDSTNFGDLPALVDQIKTEGIRFVVILDPAIAKGYDSFRRGKEQNVFVKWANSSYKPSDQAADDDILYGRVWPRPQTAFPDFFKSATQTWWKDEIVAFFKQLKFDALWIDMNEPSNFLTGTLLQCPYNKWDDPPYETMAAHVGLTGRLSEKTICMASKFGEEDEYLHYDVHNLYGYSQAIATQKAAREALVGQRSMILSRSTFAGSGKYAGHWLGDNYSTWTQMAKSIIGMLEFNMFNIPYVGADICGFSLNAEEELCQRWMQLGAFYPFSRNHNNIGFRDQDPAQWPDTVAVSSKKALEIRYRLLPYLYTLFYDSHTRGGTVARPLYHEYPMDRRSRSIDKQFLWGPALLISPVLEQGKVSLDAYLPDDVWYDYYTGIRTKGVGDVVLDAPLDHINLHIRGGFIIPAQKPAINTKASRSNNFELLVALDDRNSASGKLFWDDGESVDTVEKGLYQINTFELNEGVLTIKVEKPEGSAWTAIEQKLDSIQLMGWPFQPEGISVNGEGIDPALFQYDSDTKNLYLTYEFTMNDDFTILFDEPISA